MTNDEFASAMEILCNTFPVPNQEKRMGALFYFFKHVPIDVIRKAAESCAREYNSFPSPSAFGEFVSKFQGQLSSTQERSPCGFCDGYGWVSKNGNSYRGRCNHSNNISKKIQLDPDGIHEKIKSISFSDDFFEQEMERINKDPLQYFKGFCITGSLLKKISPPNYEKVRNYLIELIGKERSIRLWHENRAKSSIQI